MTAGFSVPAVAFATVYIVIIIIIIINILSDHSLKLSFANKKSRKFAVNHECTSFTYHLFSLAG